jgi:hypothetical protein
LHDYSLLQPFKEGDEIVVWVSDAEFTSTPLHIADMSVGMYHAGLLQTSVQLVYPAHRNPAAGRPEMNDSAPEQTGSALLRVRQLSSSACHKWISIVSR